MESGGLRRGRASASLNPQLFGGWGSCQYLLDAYCLLCALALSESRLPGDSGRVEPQTTFSVRVLASWVAVGHGEGETGARYHQGSAPSQLSSLCLSNCPTAGHLLPSVSWAAGGCPARVFLPRASQLLGLQSLWTPCSPGHELLASRVWEAGWARAEPVGADLGSPKRGDTRKKGCNLACTPQCP